MKKIPSLFCRNYEGDHLVRDEVVPGSEWVVNGEGIATRKYDGTAVMVRDGRLYKRYDAKHGKTPPPDFEPCQDAPDEVTGHWPGWVPVKADNPADKWHLAAWESIPGSCLAFGTYELCGPKFQSNPEGLECHHFIPHGTHVLADAPRDYAGIRAYLEQNSMEGIVWWHPDGRMVKIKSKDFGLPWPLSSA